MAKKKHKVPEVLWRLFNNRARTLADTIVSLVQSSPSSAAECRCEGKRCLRCSEEPISFILRAGDASEYRKLLKRSFVVFSDNAPPFPAFDPVRRWPQLEIIRRTIETMLSELSTSSNVICCGYDKHNRSSAIVKLLMCPAWDLLLRRVGDGLMVYLLKHTSIFLAFSRNKFHQVAGFTINNLCFKVMQSVSERKRKRLSLGHGSWKKTKRVDEIVSTSNKEQTSVSFDNNLSITESEVNTGVGSANSNGFSNEKCQVSSDQTLEKPRKRFRWCSSHRHRKRRQLTPCGGENDKELRKNPSYESHVLSGCSCCLVFKTLPKVVKETQINRQTMFYKLWRSSSVLPTNHILNSLKPNLSGANALFLDIFGSSDANGAAQSISCFHKNDVSLSKSPCLYHSIVRLLKIFIRKARHCRHQSLFDKHCALPSDQNLSANDGSTFEVNDIEVVSLENEHNSFQPERETLLEKGHGFDAKNRETISEARGNSYCLKKQVVSFIWAACRSIVPPELLGDPSNQRVLMRNISKFIRLRRFENFSLNQCLHKLKISKFSLLLSAYLPEVGDAKYDVKHIILKRWIFWFFSYLVVPLIEANFYVTESEHGKQEIFYYGKSSWDKLMSKTISGMEGLNYQLLTKGSVVKMISNRSFGFSRMRLRPKYNGLRALANLRAPSKLPLKQSFLNFKSVNNVLLDLHTVLKGMKMNEPKKLGSSVFDYNDVYRKLVHFLSSLKNGSTVMPDVYIVVADVSKSFDSINQEKLLSVMKDVILKDEYFLVESHEVICPRKSLRVHKNCKLVEADIPAPYPNPNLSASSHSLQSILIKQDSSRKIRKGELYTMLDEHLKRNLVQLDKKFYLQNVGIAQGSVVSALLCSFYYGHLENEVIFPFLERTFESSNEDLSGRYDSSPKHVLLRLIDDFLFMSTSKKQASMFLSRLRRGFREYNCYMNEEKFGINFDIGEISGALKMKREYVGEDGISFLRWSGLFINTYTNEIQADYTRYLNMHLSSTLTVRWEDKPVHHLKTKLCDYLWPKCHSIFYDSNINSAGVVRLNIYQSFLLSAMKFNCYVHALSSTCRLDPKSFADAIEKALRYMYKLIKTRMHTINLRSNIRPILHLEKREVELLGLTAYVRVLKRKQSCYGELLSLLRPKLMNHGKIEDMSPALQYAVDDSHSSVLWKIKY